MFKSAFLFLLIFQCSLLTAERASWVVSEAFLTPDIADFDFHSSNIIETMPEVLFAVWNGGPGKGRSNIDIKAGVGIWSSEYVDGKWSEPKQIVKAPTLVC